MNSNTDKKIELWKELNGYINKIEETYSTFFSIFSVIFGIVISILSSEWITKESLSLRIVGLLFITIAVLVTIAYLAYNFRLVAIARMYTSKLERKINEELGENIYVWNSDIIDKYVSKRNCINQYLLPIINFILFAFILITLNYIMWNLGINILWNIIYSLITISIFTGCIISFMMNEKIRKDNYIL